MEWLKENFPAISGVAAFLATLAGGAVKASSWYAGKQDEKMEARISSTVGAAVSEIMQDFSQVRERVATLEAHFKDSKEDIQEIKGKLDTLGGHVLQLPNKLAEVLKR